MDFKKIKIWFTKENIVISLKWFFFSFIWLAILLFIIDIISKQIVKNNMYVGETISLIPNFLSIQYVQNIGMAWGFNFAEQTNYLINSIILISVSTIGTIAICIVYWKFYKKLNGVGKAALMLMLAGTFGNLIDRAFYVDPEKGFHFVVDFIAFDFGSYQFPRFNVADSCLVIGTLMLIIYLFIVDFKAELAKKKNNQAQFIDNQTKQNDDSSQNKNDDDKTSHLLNKNQNDE